MVDGHLRDVRKLPHLGDAGQGVNRKLPHLGNAGRGVNREMPHLGNAGQGVNREMPHLGDAGQKDIINRGLEAYMASLADRLSTVRITCGDWRRVLKPSVTRATAGNSTVGLFLDPPYETGHDLYATTNAVGNEFVSSQVREWCRTADTRMRIVLSGYEDEHDDLAELGWSKINGKSGGGAGYNVNPDAGRREKLWLSPACLRQADLFTEAPA